MVQDEHQMLEFLKFELNFVEEAMGALLAHPGVLPTSSLACFY